MTLQDLLAWVDGFIEKTTTSDQLRHAQRFALLRSCDIFASGQRISRDALANFLEGEQHAVAPEALDALLAELGTNGQLSNDDLRVLVGKSKSDTGRAKGSNVAPPRPKRAY